MKCEESVSFELRFLENLLEFNLGMGLVKVDIKELVMWVEKNIKSPSTICIDLERNQVIDIGVKELENLEVKLIYFKMANFTEMIKMIKFIVGYCLNYFDYIHNNQDSYDLELVHNQAI